MLSEILSLDIFRFLLVFARVGSTIMLLPGLGGQLVNIRIRLLFALAVSFVMLPALYDQLPGAPADFAVMLRLVFGEIVAGVYLGTVISFLMSTINLAGTIVGYQTSLTNAFSFDPIAQQQSQLLTGFLSNIAMLAVFATDLHHLMFQAIADSYGLFKPGLALPWGDFSETLSHLLTRTFRFGLQFAAPLVVFGMVFYTALGLLARLVPQIQIFFLSMPVQVLVGLWVFTVTLPIMIGLFLRFFEDTLLPYSGGS